MLQGRARPRAHPQAPEAEIPVANNALDRALKTHKRRSRLLSAGILALGLMALLLAMHFSPARRRQRAAAVLPLGADSGAVLRALGPAPTRCPPGAMERLSAAMGVDQMQADSAVIQLRRDTRQRWLYPGRHGCVADQGDTELGLDSAGRLLWIQAATGKGNLRLSPSITL